MTDTPECFSFNLVTEPWIPCVRLDGTREPLGLEGTLTQAHELREIHDDSPLVTVTVHRLLLAILHHIFGPEDADAWAKLWQGGRGQFDAIKVSHYFHDPAHPKRLSRFDLFDPERPFYQTAEMPLIRVSTNENGETKLVRCDKTVAKLAIETSQNATLFHHELEEFPTPIKPAEAARLLLARQGFSTENLATAENAKGKEPVTASPLVKGAVALVVGESLFQTLMLNLHQYNIDLGEPFSVSPEAVDLPAWDRTEPATRKSRLPVGYLDLLTWQSRRIRLLPTRGEDGTAFVRSAAIMGGEQFDGVDRHDYETMVGFQKNSKAKSNEDPWLPIGFDEAKSLWRNSHVLFDTFLVDQKRPAPKTVRWLLQLRDEGVIDAHEALNMQLCGLDSNKASVLFWRHERLPFPLRLLGNSALLVGLRDALQHAEEVHDSLRSAVWQFAKMILTRNEAKQPSKQQKEDINKLAETFNAERAYWAALEIKFHHFLRTLPDCADEADPLMAREALVLSWCNTLRSTANRVFKDTVGREDASAREHKAFVVAERTFRSLLRKRLPEAARAELVGQPF